MRLTFLGATQTVTGSRFLVEHAGKRVLVDCGLFQGVKSIRRRNWEPLPIPARSIDAIVLTHAHVDHCGYLPVVVRDGFSGMVHCTPATRDLCGVILPDAGHLQEEEAKYRNKRGRTRHHPAQPLFTVSDAEAALGRLRATGYNIPIDLGGGMTLSFQPAGHIIGSSVVRIQAEGKTVVFTGDVGRPHGPVMPPPAPLGDVDYLVMETTYGNRLHAKEDPRDALADIISRTMAREGTLLIPAFAVGRAQAILHLVSELKQARRIPDVPVYLNSPMAIRATSIFLRHMDEHTLSEAQCDNMENGVTRVTTVEESKALTRNREPKIVVSASGMATGGRILHHLKESLPDRRNAVLFVGFQAAGTRGEALVGGIDKIKIHGEYVEVRAEIAQLDGLSVHADYQEMLGWLSTATTRPERVFLVHGETAAQDAMRRNLADFLGWDAEIPEYRQSAHLWSDLAAQPRRPRNRPNPAE